MAEVTLLEMEKTIIVPIQSELHDRAAVGLQEAILKKLESTGATRLIIDVSGVSIVDSFLGRLLGETARMAQLLGANTALVGLRKEIALTLVQLGLVLGGIHTALNLNEGIRLLEELEAEQAARHGFEGFEKFEAAG